MNRKTLVFCPIGLGNFIMATPSLEFLSRELGKENLALLALKPAIRDMASESGFFGEIFFWDPDKQNLAAGLKTLARIRRARFDQSLSLFPTSHWKFSLFALLSGVRARIGFRYPLQKMPARIQQTSLDLDPNAHDVDQNLRLAEALLGKTGPRPPNPVFPLQPVFSAERKIENYFVCHPGSSAERGMREKRLPAAAYAELIRRIHAEFGLRGLLIGGPEELALREEITRAAPESTLTRPSKNLRELAGLVQDSRFFLGNDSGLMHIAAALGKRCLVFFGPTDERRNGPYAYWEKRDGLPKHLILRRTDLDCAPCRTLKNVGSHPPCVYGDTRCLRDFPAEAAWPRIRDFLRSFIPAQAA